MVTKQQQLEWLAKNCESWPVMSEFIVMHSTNIGICGSCWEITLEEWHRERYKMQKQAAQAAQQVQPSQPAPDNSWNERGEFPPAGCECEAEYDTNRKEWHKVRIIGVDNGECFFRWLSGASNGYVTGYKRNIDFRPIRTEREKAIDEMIAAFEPHYGSVAVANKHAGIAEMLYDAGYRKVNP